MGQLTFILQSNGTTGFFSRLMLQDGLLSAFFKAVCAVGQFLLRRLLSGRNAAEFHLLDGVETIGAINNITIMSRGL